MSGGLNLYLIGLIVFCLATETAREVCFKQAAHNVSVKTAMLHPLTWLGVFFWAAELVAWTLTLEHMPLSIAFPLMAFSYVTVVLAGAWVFKEPVTLRHGIGAVLITVGVACVGATGL